jgi:hypothetical protein
MEYSSDTERVPAGKGWCSGYDKDTGEACECREFQRDLERPTRCEECQHGKSLHDKKSNSRIPVDRTARAIFKQMTRTVADSSSLALGSGLLAQATRTEAKKEAAIGLKGVKGKVSHTGIRGILRTLTIIVIGKECHSKPYQRQPAAKNWRCPPLDSRS